MDNPDKQFRYRMEPLLKVRQWDLDVAKADEVRAHAVVKERAEASERVQRAIVELEAAIRLAYTAGASIDADRHQRLTVLLKTRRTEYQERLAELQQAEKMHEQTRRQVQRVKQGVLTLEKHKEGQQAERDQDRFRHEQKQLDDLWLLRRRQGKNEF